MYDFQKQLRDFAKTAMEARGHTQVEVVRGSGGARVESVEAGQKGLALVRTSADRWVGWMRDSQGELRGLDKASLVVVAALDNKKKPTKAEIYAFDPKDVRATYESVIAARRAQSPKLSETAPIFVCLDPWKPSVFGNLKAQAVWRQEVPLERNPQGRDRQAEASRESSEGISIPEAKRRLAINFGVPPESIEITIRG